MSDELCEGSWQDASSWHPRARSGVRTFHCRECGSIAFGWRDDMWRLPAHKRHSVVRPIMPTYDAKPEGNE